MTTRTLWEIIPDDEVDPENDSYVTAWMRPVKTLGYPSARLAKMLDVTQITPPESKPS